MSKHVWLTVILNFRWWKTFRSWGIPRNSDGSRDQAVDVVWRLTILLKKVQVSSSSVEINSKSDGAENSFLLLLWIFIQKYMFCLCLRGKQLQIFADRHSVLIPKFCNLWQIHFVSQRMKLLHCTCELRCLQNFANKRCFHRFSYF